MGGHTRTLWMALWLGLDIHSPGCWPLVLSSSAFPRKHTRAYTGLKVSLRAGLDSLVPPLVSSELSGLSSSWPRPMATSILSPTALTILVSLSSLKFTGDCRLRYALTHSSLSSAAPQTHRSSDPWSDSSCCTQTPICLHSESLTWEKSYKWSLIRGLRVPWDSLGRG